MFSPSPRRSRRAPRAGFATFFFVALFALLRTALAQNAPGGASSPVVVVQTGHNAPIQTAAVRPDGAQMATGDNSGQVKVWDLRGGLLARTLQLPKAEIRSLAYSADGASLLVGSTRETSLWNSRTGEKVRAFETNVSHGYADWLGTGQVAWIDLDGVRVADATTGTLLKTLGASGDVLQGESLSTSPDGSTVAVGTFDGTLLLFGTKNSTPHRLKGTATAVHALAFSPDGKRLAVGGRDGIMEVWDVDAGRVVTSSRDLQAKTPNDVSISIYRLRFLPGGGEVLGATLNGLRQWDARTGKITRTFGEGEYFTANRLDALALSPDGGVFVTGGSNGLLQVGDVRSGRLIYDLSSPSPGLKKAIWVPAAQTPGGPLIPSRVALLDRDGCVSVWDLRRGQILWTTRRAGKLATNRRDGSGSDLAVSPDGKWIVSAHGNYIALRDAATGTLAAWLGEKADMANLGASKIYQTVAFAPKGHIIAGYERFIHKDGPCGWECWDLTDPFVPKSQYQVALPADVAFIGAMAVDEAGKWLAVGANGEGGVPTQSTAYLFDLTETDRAGAATTPARTFTIDPYLVQAMAFQPGTGYLATFGLSDPALKLWDVATDNPVTGERVPVAAVNGGPGHSGMRAMAFLTNGRGLMVTGDDGKIRVFATAFANGKSTVRLQNTTPVDNVPTNALSVAGDGRLLLGLGDGRAEIWDFQTKRRVSLIPGAAGEYVLYSDEGFYRATRGALRRIAFRSGDRMYGIEQFDLSRNRPDKIVSALGGDGDLIRAYEAARLKRLARAPVAEGAETSEINLPQLTLSRTDVPLILPATQTLLRFRANLPEGAGTDVLEAVQVRVNGAPSPFGLLLSGAKESITVRAGEAILPPQSRVAEGALTIPLSTDSGGKGRKNRIEVWVRARSGTKSLGEAVEIVCSAPPAPRHLYVIAIGVSHYQTPSADLRFAAKDATDLAKALGSVPGFTSVHSLLLTDTEVTREKVQAAHTFLEKAGVDDTVILFVAGHGVLDRNLNYFFATHDIDFRRPGERGLSYTDLEAVLDGVPARQKLLLMDTCHAGEVDPDAASSNPSAPGSRGAEVGAGVTVRQTRGIGVEGVDGAPSPALSSSAAFSLMQELFANLSAGSGADVIAAAAGAEYAYEQQGNGVFTAALLTGLQGEADADHDGLVTVSEIRAFVTEQVRKATGGRQTPTSRSEIVGQDWGVARTGKVAARNP